MRRTDRNGSGNAGRCEHGAPPAGAHPAPAHPAPAHPAPAHPADADAAEAACGYWNRRGLHTDPAQVVTAPGAALLLLALLAAAGDGERPAGGVLLPRPCAAWYAPQVRLLGRPLRPVPVPAECGGVPDPVALLEAVRRARAAGDDPRVLVLSVADDPTGTAVPPELLHEVCEAASDEGLLIVSDESWRDTAHDPHGTVVVSPAEMLAAGHADSVAVLADLTVALLPDGPPVGVARLPGTEHGRTLAEAVRAALAALHARLPEPAAAAAAEALAEPAAQRALRASGTRRHGALAAGLHHAVTEAGALCRPPDTGRHLYADLEPVRSALAVHGIEDAAALEAELTRRLGPGARGGHHFGDDPGALRVRLSTRMLPDGPPSSPGVREALDAVRGEFARLTRGGP